MELLYSSKTCVNDGTGKMIFGRGTELKVQNISENPVHPQYYQLQDHDTKVCLATGFTRHNLTEKNVDFKDTSASPIRDYRGDPTGYYNQVVFLEGDKNCSELKLMIYSYVCFTVINKPDDKCTSTVDPDEMVNLASLTIFGLRVIFMKTVIFNVLMTLRLWISQCEYRTALLTRAQTGKNDRNEGNFPEERPDE
ncbi:M1-specific T cell receptor alpha chain-like [Cyprinodon tularosa]|uniref:M1-specific T cell receptor alpha chain-like n=1 Tax=Cyprinodon tularosa TaxID=77115 RepID=UPI0018E1DF27|nr:M1-specific T cell receptor alpha chain-like [Cyprinodon tularosa]